MNVIAVTGNVNKPEFLTTPKGASLLKFDLAENTFVNGADFTQWYKVALWGKRAEKLQNHINKGTKVTVIGSLKTSTWSKGDKDFFSLDLTCNDIEFTNTKRQDDNPTESILDTAKTMYSSESKAEFTTDDIPF